MTEDLQQLSELLNKLMPDRRKVTQSEKDLRDFLGFKSSSLDHYIEHSKVVDQLLKCCVQKRPDKIEFKTDNIQKTYELLRNDAYRLNTNELETNNVQFTKIDQLEFFNFLNKLYDDPEFVSDVLKNEFSTKTQIEDIRQNLELLLKYQIREYFENTKLQDENIIEFGFQSKQDLYDEAYKRLNQLSLSSCLKNIYYKDAMFTIQADLRILLYAVYSELASDNESFIKLDSSNRRFIHNIIATLAGAGTVSLILSPLDDSGSLRDFADAALLGTAIVSFTDFINRKKISKCSGYR